MRRELLAEYADTWEPSDELEALSGLHHDYLVVDVEITNSTNGMRMSLKFVGGGLTAGQKMIHQTATVGKSEGGHFVVPCPSSSMEMVWVGPVGATAGDITGTVVVHGGWYHDRTG